ncbi:MAG: alcohol dehydrogenase, partial [Deltaproteobacteria bacterium]|nr:alcohol dehydrogenase [Deltaproteobacteria bacterium]
MPHFRDAKRTLSKEREEYPIKMQHAYPSVNIGWGAHSMVGNDAKALGMTNALIVTTGLKGTGIIEEIQGILK